MCVGTLCPGFEKIICFSKVFVPSVSIHWIIFVLFHVLFRKVFFFTLTGYSQTWKFLNLVILCKRWIIVLYLNFQITMGHNWSNTLYLVFPFIQTVFYNERITTFTFNHVKSFYVQRGWSRLKWKTSKSFNGRQLTPGFYGLPFKVFIR